jgi:starvation-inducible DNA-binding protein
METAKNAKTQNYQQVADELTHLLADTYILYLKTQNFHWNVTGPEFHSLHLLFEGQYQELALAIDEIAERIRALKAVAPASFSHYSKLSSLKEENGVPSSQDMLKQLLQDNETIINHANLILAKTEQAHDEGTADLLVQRIQAHQKAAWMLRSSIG